MAGLRTLRKTEHDEQVVVIEWAALNGYRWPHLCWLHAVPNGGGRSKAEAGRLKAEGVKPGVQDLILSVPRGKYHGLKIEMKAVGGTEKPDQKVWREGMNALGYRAVVCTGATEAIRELESYLSLGPFRVEAQP